MLRCTMNLLRPNPVGRFAPAALFRPDSVAVIGAGTPMGAEVMRNLRDAGFHRIRVVAKRSGVEVRSRPGYWASNRNP